MSKLIAVLLAALSLFNWHNEAHNSQFDKLHKAEHYIITMDDSQAAGCTAYAIGPHALLTAEHCDLKDIDENGKQRDGSPIVLFVDSHGKLDYIFSHSPYTIESKLFDGSDHMILLLSGPAFTNTIEYNPSDPYMGERVFTWGNPHGIRNQYREGYVTGSDTMPVPSQIHEGLCYIFDLRVQPGDSGSAIFDASDGHIIGIVTYGLGSGMFMGAFTLHFNPSEIEYAQHYSN